MGIKVVAKNHSRPPKTMLLLQIILKITIYKLQILYMVHYFLCHSHVICISFVCAHILSICTRISFVCQSHVLVCHPYVTRIYLFVIRMPLVCTRMSSLCHSYVTRMWCYHEPSDSIYLTFCTSLKKLFTMFSSIPQ